MALYNTKKPASAPKATNSSWSQMIQAAGLTIERKRMNPTENPTSVIAGIQFRDVPL